MSEDSCTKEHSGYLKIREKKGKDGILESWNDEEKTEENENTEDSRLRDRLRRAEGDRRKSETSYPLSVIRVGASSRLR
jgi:hypothetical protein